MAARGARVGLWLEHEQRGHRVRSSLVILLSLHNPGPVARARAARALAGRCTASRAAQEGPHWFSKKQRA